MHTRDALIEDIMSKISFRFVQPETRASFEESSDLTKIEAFRALDVANTNIWDRETKIFDLTLLSTPRLSTVAISYIINNLVKHMPEGEAYLNLGCWCGFSLFAGIIGNEGKTCIGVDNFTDVRDVRHIFGHQYQHFRNANTKFFEMDYFEYFKTIHKEKIGVYFFDGEHSYEHQLRALEVADPFLAAGSYILIDDTSQGAPRDATLDFLRSRSGHYSLVLDTQTPNNCHPSFWCGIMILKKI